MTKRSVNKIISPFMSPKTKEQFEEIRQRSAATILQAALELFAHQGYKGTSISRIAKEAGVSKGLIYNYYPSKEALLEAIVKGAMAEGEKLMESNIRPELPAREQLQHLIESTFSILQSNLHYWKLFTSLAFQPGILDHFQDLIIKMATEHLQVLENLLTEIGFEHPRKEALILGATLDGLGFHVMNNASLFSLDEMKDYIIDKYCNY